MSPKAQHRTGDRDDLERVHRGHARDLADGVVRSMERHFDQVKSLPLKDVIRPSGKPEPKVEREEPAEYRHADRIGPPDDVLHERLQRERVAPYALRLACPAMTCTAAVGEPCFASCGGIHAERYRAGIRLAEMTS